MKKQIAELNFRLKAVHRRFLANELQEAEKLMERRLTSFDFLFLLTADGRFTWLQPFSALIAEIDAFLDEQEVILPQDVHNIRQQIRTVLLRPETRISERFEHYLSHDGEFILLHSQMYSAFSSLESVAEQKSHELVL